MAVHGPTVTELGSTLLTLERNNTSVNTHVACQRSLLFEALSTIFTLERGFSSVNSSVANETTSAGEVLPAKAAMEALLLDALLLLNTKRERHHLGVQERARGGLYTHRRRHVHSGHAHGSVRSRCRRHRRTSSVASLSEDTQEILHRLSLLGNLVVELLGDLLLQLLSELEKRLVAGSNALRIELGNGSKLLLRLRLRLLGLKLHLLGHRTRGHLEGHRYLRGGAKRGGAVGDRESTVIGDSKRRLVVR